MFMGEYRHSMDSKGRVIIPAKFRDELGNSFVITRGLDNCLFVYPMEEWRVLEEKMKALPLTSKNARTFVRFFFSGAVETELDKQGRVSLPANLRDYASLEKDVVIIGVSSRMELWSGEDWDGYLAAAESSYEEIAETMEELGI
ncbi:MAG: division/cell wall cluster transcriptional repressor MraZ [Halanaerobium sp.]|nr:division/cell wall cluster transcriptional repressor MraZ [Halanaerobium sp.]